MNTRQKQEALEQLFWRTLREFEDQTGERVEKVSVERVYEDISSVRLRLCLGQ